MKKITSKSLLSLGLTLALAVGMSMAVFADVENVTTTNKRHIRANSRAMYLNLEGSGNAYTNRNVTIYNYSSDNDQYWTIENLGKGLKVYSKKSDNGSTVYALNMNQSNYNCNIFPDVVSNNRDSVVNTIGSSNQFEIDLRNYNLNLTVLQSGRNATWGDVNTFYWSLY